MSARRALLTAFWLTAWICGASGETPAKQAPPQRMFWSWFADDDFRPIADSGAGVAYLALSLRFEGPSGVIPFPRASSVRIPPPMYQMAVVRFDYEFQAGNRPAFSPRQRQLAVRMIEEIASVARPPALQIDFDAPRSAWPFYRQLLSEVRSRIGTNIFLSITALVSWCDSPQSWLAGLPVDEFVPMAFSMGRATPATVTVLQRGGQLSFPGCRASLGVELPSGLTALLRDSAGSGVRPRREQRAYFFPGGERWTAELILKAEKLVLP